MLPALRIMDTEHQKIVQPENKPSRKTMFYSLEDAEVKGAKEQFFFFFLPFDRCITSQKTFRWSLK